ncbi:MAG: hypothetical protein KAT31_02930 [Bacteroidales bacterium]|nr:hypothetical protein [Bacteroidales bacterium]
MKFSLSFLTKIQTNTRNSLHTIKFFYWMDRKMTFDGTHTPEIVKFKGDTLIEVNLDPLEIGVIEWKILEPSNL